MRGGLFSYSLSVSAWIEARFSAVISSYGMLKNKCIFCIMMLFDHCINNI